MAEFKSPKTPEDLEVNFAQIHPDMDATMAHYESSRCLYCYDAPCIQACPTGIDIPLFIRQIRTNNLSGAAKTIYTSNYFGQVCGKVCPTSVLCEGACVYNDSDVPPIQIGALQSFACDHAISEDVSLEKPIPSGAGRVAVIGAGPAGIACACELSSLGYTVDIFEEKDKPSGLVLHGNAPYKITNREVMREVDYLTRQFGLEIKLNSPIRTPEDLQQLEENYDAIFLGIGMGPTGKLGIPGEHLTNVLGGIEFIEEVKLNPLNALPGNRVVVIGGGNTAMDAACESAKLGAESVILAYRRSREEMGAYSFEYQHAKENGVKGMFNVQPIAIRGEEKVESLTLAVTQSTADGNQLFLTEQIVELDCDVVILATGQQKRRNFLQMIDGLELTKSGLPVVQPESLQTSNPRYFAGGDAMNGGAEVVNAAAEGKKAARGIHRMLAERKRQ